jgi:hypothetical protein
VKTTALRWLALLLIPGCILVQPLDAAKPDDDDSGASGGPAKAGSANGSSGAPAKAGAGNAGRAGGATSGAPNGGGSGAVDFTLFTGDWTLSGGTITTRCQGAATKTTDADTGGVDTVGLGTDSGAPSDLVFGPGSSCEIWADVDDRDAYLNPATPACSDNDGVYQYYLTTDDFDFKVSADDQTATADINTTVLTTELSTNYQFTCTVEQNLKYQRGGSAL